MAVWHGSYKGRYPCVKLQVAGTKGHPEEMVATVDTGFSGFLLIPQNAAEPHGLTIVGTTMATLADGSKQPMTTAMVNVGFAACTRSGVATLVPRESGVLVGLDFLRKFELALILTHTDVCLTSIDEVSAFMASLSGRSLANPARQRASI